MSQINKLNILIAAGGTGGHLFPAMAVAEELTKQTDGNINLFFVGSNHRIESRIVPAKGYKLFTIDISGLNKLLSWNTILLPFKIYRSVRYCRKLIKENKIHAVIVAGAYLSYPPGIAAHKEKIPLFVMESNVNPGKTNKLLANKAKLIFTSFQESSDYYTDEIKSRIICTGNPVRSNILAMPEREAGILKFGLNTDKKTLLIFGGSLGANAINNAVKENLDALSSLNINIIWQTGMNFEFSEFPDNIKILTFIDDMGSAYAAADLVVCRSGATTVAELCIAGKPSVLIPLPGASNNEQYHNAKVLENAGAALMIDNNYVTRDLYPVVKELIVDGGRMTVMGQKALSLGRPDAAEKCAREILSINI